MRVVLDVSAVPTRPVGAGMYTIALAHGLSAHDGVELHLVTRRADSARWSAVAPAATVHAAAPTARPHRLAWEQLGSASISAQVRPDVWHGPHYTLPIRARVPTVVTVHDLTFFEHPEWHERTKVAYFRPMIAAAARRATVVVCVSAFTARRLRAHVQPQGDMVVVPHGVDHGRFTPAGAGSASDHALLARHGIEPPYIAFAGTIEPRKDVPTLVRAFARLAPERPELRLVLAGGDGWGAAAARNAVAASGVSTRILRPGYVDDAVFAALFRNAAAVAYPSLEEGFGLPALEALACGTPLVTTRGSALEEVVGDAALLVAPGDDVALADALRTILHDEELAARLRAAGPDRAATYTWERSVDAHVDAYRRAVGTHVPA
jgi:glycosyltransferase involved in cell wall biosynthesis